MTSTAAKLARSIERMTLGSASRVRRMIDRADLRRVLTEDESRVLVTAWVARRDALEQEHIDALHDEAARLEAEARRERMIDPLTGVRRRPW